MHEARWLWVAWVRVGWLRQTFWQHVQTWKYLAGLSWLGLALVRFGLASLQQVGLACLALPCLGSAWLSSARLGVGLGLELGLGLGLELELEFGFG